MYPRKTSLTGTEPQASEGVAGGPQLAGPWSQAAFLPTLFIFHDGLLEEIGHIVS